MSKSTSDNFESLMTQFNESPLAERDLAGSHPASSRQGKIPRSFNIKYGTFQIGREGNPKLEEIMDDCTQGKKVLIWEKINVTKEGDVMATIKYMIPQDVKKEEASAIKGMRRRNKKLAEGGSDAT